MILILNVTRSALAMSLYSLTGAVNISSMVVVLVCSDDPYEHLQSNMFPQHAKIYSCYRVNNLMSEPVNSRPIGRVTAPGEQNNQLKVQTKDNQYTRTGEFLTYCVRDDAGTEREVIMTVNSRQISRSIPNSYMADPELSADDLAAALGIDDFLTFVEYELVCTIIGYFDEQLSTFVNPRINPDPNTLVYLASDALVQKAIFAKKEGDIGSGSIGRLLFRPHLPVVIDMDEMLSTHLAILAGTGSGKSYLARVLLEEFMKPYNRAAICIFDPHGEYSTLTELSRTYRTDKYKPEVKIFTPGVNLQITVSELKESELKLLLYNLSDKGQQTLSELLASVRTYDPHTQSYHWRVSKLVSAIEERLVEAPDESSTLQAIKWRINKRFKPNQRENRVFVDDAGTTLTDIFRPGLCSIIDLSSVDEETQQVICALLLNKTYDSRVKYKLQETQDPKNELKYPVFVLLEEAHRFAPQGERDTVSNVILRRILAEGRKFGIGVGLITQRPGKLDQNVLSQCMTQFLMRIINSVDQESIKQGVESAGRELLDDLPSLTKGQAIISGVAVRSPILMKVRTADTRHGGASLRASAEWAEHSSSVLSQASTAILRNAVTDPLDTDY